MNNDINFKKQQKILLVILIFVILFIILILSINIINDGEVGVKKTLGKYDNNELYSGVHFIAPFISSIQKVNIKEKKIDEMVSVPAKDGLIVDLDTTVIIKIKDNRASEIIQTVSNSIENTKVKPYIRNGIRDIVSDYDSTSVYTSSSRQEIADKLKIFLQDKLEKDIEIVDVLLRDVKLPEKVTNAIEDKLDKQQQYLAKQFELDSAKKDAEIEIARAKGIAESNKIISNSITKEYLQYKFIEGLNDGNTEVIYVPTEANIPIMEAMRFDKNINNITN